MAEQEKPQEEQEPVIISVPEITHLASIAIQVHELFLELKKSGFRPDEALTLAGMVLSGTGTVERFDDSEFYEEEFEITISDDEEEFGNWDTILEENPEGDEKL
jgi:hypothetical protein